MKVVIDTNVIIAAFRNEKSASAKIIEDCLSGGLQPFGSAKTKNEAKRIVQRATPGKENWIKLDKLLYKTSEVIPTQRFDIATDKSDNLYFEAAYASGCKMIITNDHHLLEHDGYWGIRVMRPAEFLKSIKEG